MKIELETDFDVKVSLVVSRAYGQLDLLLRDTITAIREIGCGTTKTNRYRYEEVG